MKKFFIQYKEVVGTLIAFAILLSPTLVTAVGTFDGSGSGQFNAAQNNSSGSSCPPYTVCNPLKFKTICGLVKGLLQAVMIIGIPIAVLFIVWAGFKFVMAQGKSDALIRARANLLWVIIGVAIFLAASLIAQVIMNTIEQLGVTGISSCS
jgi:hypothetical protein